MALSLNIQRAFRAPLGLGVACALGLGVACALGLAGCVRDNAPDSAAGAAQPAAPPPLVFGDVPLPAPYSADVVWSRAATGDDFALARLGRREGAGTLLAAVAEGGSLGRLALQALPYARDRHEARGPLCELLPRADAAGRGLLLDALFAAVVGAPATEDSLDPAADAACVRQLDAAARLEHDAPLVRDRALAVRGRLQTP